MQEPLLHLLICQMEGASEGSDGGRVARQGYPVATLEAGQHDSPMSSSNIVPLPMHDSTHASPACSEAQVVAAAKAPAASPGVATRCATAMA
jgi:hypothetical protein